MKTILLSFKPIWFEKIKEGEKIFEYRKQFPAEEVRAYLYVSTPVQAIVGVIELGKRVSLEDLKVQYQDKVEVLERIRYYQNNNKYVMPIKSFQMTQVVSIERLKDECEKFVVPQMYYYLDKKPELLKYIEENCAPTQKSIINKFDKLTLDDICKRYN